MGILSIIIGVGKIIGIIVGVLLGVAYVTIAERKYMSSIQRRRGPNVVGMYGMLQPFGDGLKLLLKETVMPTSANWVVFMCAPGITFTLALMSWAVIPIGAGKVYSDINIGVMYIMGISALGVYGIIMAGWASNSKYAFMGAMRSTAQMISYEVSIGFTLVTCMLCAGTMNMTGIVWGQERVWNMIPLMPIMLIFVISILAETNRHPFDLPEAEAELVSGYNVEYSGAGFALFFLGEYGNMIMMSGLTVILFMGGWMMPFKEAWGGPVVFGVKTLLMICVYIWARAAFPRYRYDQLMGVGWKVLLPLAMGWVVITAGVLHIM